MKHSKKEIYNNTRIKRLHRDSQIMDWMSIDRCKVRTLSNLFGGLVAWISEALLLVSSEDLCVLIGAHDMVTKPRGYLKRFTWRALQSKESCSTSQWCGWRNVFVCVCVRCFVVIIWWLKMFNQFIFDVANVGRSLAFIGRDGFY